MKATLLQTTGFASILRRLVVAGLASHACFATVSAYAEEPSVAGATLSDEALSPGAPALNLEFSQRGAPGPHLNIAPALAADGEAQGPRRFGYVLSANGGAMDLSVSQHVIVDEESEGEPERRGRGAEVRVGGAFTDLRGGATRGDGDTMWYVFAASDDEAMTWRPGGRNSVGSSFALQDQVEIGDMQAGVTLETRGVQASLAYIEREVKSRIGARSVTQDENFAGLTVTMRR